MTRIAADLVRGTTTADDDASLTMEWELSRLVTAAYSLDRIFVTERGSEISPALGSRPNDRGIHPP